MYPFLIIFPYVFSNACNFVSPIQLHNPMQMTPKLMVACVFFCEKTHHYIMSPCAYFCCVQSRIIMFSHHKSFSAERFHGFSSQWHHDLVFPVCFPILYVSICFMHTLFQESSVCIQIPYTHFCGSFYLCLFCSNLPLCLNSPGFQVSLSLLFYSAKSLFLWFAICNSVPFYQIMMTLDLSASQ
jgi:hypothetical protein